MNNLHPWNIERVNDYKWRFEMTPEERAIARELGLRHYTKPTRSDRFWAWLYQYLP